MWDRGAKRRGISARREAPRRHRGDDARRDRGAIGRAIATSHSQRKSLEPSGEPPHRGAIGRAIAHRSHRASHRNVARVFAICCGPLVPGRRAFRALRAAVPQSLRKCIYALPTRLSNVYAPSPRAGRARIHLPGGGGVITAGPLRHYSRSPFTLQPIPFDITPLPQRCGGLRNVEGDRL